MKQPERDELLIRIDERLKTLKDGDEGDIPEIKERLKQLNGAVKTNTIWRRVTVSIGGTGLVVIIGWLLRLTLGG
ncbi:hypothetical protein LCGC14_0405810 [marine sediment metagenome]|uniref:Uncharacterized protein n=1 Tax=marine sediment metagenome TaxID=412755 RepID=A0A0F9TDC4_9ZZZZ